jgi:hypothetical protein
MPNHGLEPGGFGNDPPEETPPKPWIPAGQPADREVAGDGGPSRDL